MDKTMEKIITKMVNNIEGTVDQMVDKKQELMYWQIIGVFNTIDPLGFFPDAHLEEYKPEVLIFIQCIQSVDRIEESNISVLLSKIIHAVSGIYPTDMKITDLSQKLYPFIPTLVSKINGIKSILTAINECAKNASKHGMITSRHLYKHRSKFEMTVNEQEIIIKNKDFS